ncbi:hypothetical protein HCT46_05085 [Spirochaetales bacterium BR208]|uniref:Uncharacterized protein n=2 Tax=Entomospira nematocerorum TaxID=2719987 RepID=A0A968GDK0_9SPIO|nr:hypothetical protein [Entomospira nematocera]NIZ47289.1 hypothetical protein [Entomospira nematocera]
MYTSAISEGMLDEFNKLDRVFNHILFWLESNSGVIKSHQTLLAIKEIYKKVKAEVEEKKE